MGNNPALITGQTATQAISRTPSVGRPPCTDRYFVCITVRHSVGDAPPGNGLRLRYELLAASACVAQGGRMDSAASAAVVQTARCRQTGFLSCHHRQFFGAFDPWGKKTGPNPTDRRKAGSKHHLLVDAQGLPVNIILTKANRRDVTQLMPLIEGVAPIAGKRGRPLHKPTCVQADRAYDSGAHRQALKDRGIRHQIARRRTEHGSNLGKTRWVVERTIAWLHQFRRLRVRYERLPSIHEAFLRLGCAIICWRTLKNSFC
jgi:transposase